MGFAAPGPRASASKPITYAGDGHLCAVAPTRSGKGRGVIVPNLLLHDGPVVVFDPKGELYRVTARRRREMGQKVYKLDPCRVVGEETDTLNPLDIFSLPGADIETDSQVVAHWLSDGNRGAKEPFWDISGTALNTALVAHSATLPLDQRNLATVRKYLFSDDVVYNLAVLLDTVGKSMNKMAKDEIAAFLQTTDVTRSGMLATAQAYLKPFLSPRLAEALSNSTVPLDGVLAGDPMTIYMILPPDKLKSHKALLKMWAGTLLKALTSRATVPAQRTLLLLDEAAQLGNFPPLETAVTLCVGYGLQVWTFWQDLAQLKSCYPDSWQTVLNNCAVLQTFGINNRQMASQWGDYLGRGAAELAALPADRQVVAIQGSGELCCRRADYLRDPIFAGLFDDNPLYGRSGPTTGTARDP
jgi:type IV secretion system protein VirD4